MVSIRQVQDDQMENERLCRRAIFYIHQRLWRMFDALESVDFVRFAISYQLFAVHQKGYSDGVKKDLYSCSLCGSIFVRSH